MEQFLKENPNTNIRLLKNFASTYCGIGCRYCGKKELPGKRKTFCSKECVDNYCMRTSTTYLRNLIFRRDKGICNICLLDTKLISRQIYDSEKRTGERSSLRDTHQIGDKRVKRNGMSCWDADHVQMVALGGGLSGLENFRTLCKSCHKTVTRSQQELLKQMRKEKKMKISNDSIDVKKHNIINMSTHPTSSKKSPKITPLEIPSVPDVAYVELPISPAAPTNKKSKALKKSKVLPLEEVVESKKTKKVAKVGPKKPLSAYFLYLNDFRASYKKEHPELSFAQLSKGLAEQWNNLPAEGKAQYVATADILKGGYDAEKQKIKDDAPPKKPLTAFFIFLNDNRASYRQEHPELSFADLTKALSVQWASLDSVEKAKYDEKAKDMKNAYKSALVEWKATHPVDA